MLPPPVQVREITLFRPTETKHEMALQKPFPRGGAFLKAFSIYPFLQDHDIVVGLAYIIRKCNISCHIVGFDSRTVYNPNPKTRSRGANATKRA